MGLRKKKETQREAWVLGLSKKRYSRKPNREAGRSWARLLRIYQSQREGILGKHRENRLRFEQFKETCLWAQGTKEVMSHQPPII